MKASSTSYIARFDTLTSTVKLVTWIALIAFLLPTSISRPANAAPLVQEDPPTRLPYDAPFTYPYLEAAAPPTEAQPGLLEPEYANWTKLVFQSYRNRSDWEIYSARGDGSNQANLTNRAGMDIHARLSRGASRIVFASNRHGNYDIFVMSAGGTTTRLTENDADDVYPAWSPNDTKIAFQSYRDGQAEIYVMNANGSNPTRLTSYGDYDGMPTWSPDGAKIAFVRRSAGQSRIWVMDATGANPQQRSTQAISEGPAWSPDGTKIAYDADGNGDTWQEVWLMDASGANQRQVYDPPEGQTDAWVRSWSPDGRYVAFSRITWIQQGGNWYWTQASLDAWDSANPSNTVFLSSTGFDWHPDWRSTDLQAPSSSVQALPAQSPVAFTVRWSGADTGGAGLKSFDIQVRDGAGVWTDLRNNTTATSASFTGIGGHSYFFRSRARDIAGNLEPWPADYDAMTTVEALAPSSAVLPLPATSRRQVLVRWAGSDQGGSGIQNYDVQVRSGSGAWTDWQMATTGTSAVFTGAAGVQHRFRVRARDRAQNLEAWPTSADASTLVYSWAIRGRVTDNRGVPVVGVGLVTAPAAFQTATNDAEGLYSAYVAGDSASYTTTWSKAPYGALPATAFPPDPDPNVHVVLPPADNVVQNWGFEDGATGWQFAGTLPASVISSDRHTGASAAYLGAGASPLRSITILPDAPSYPAKSLSTVVDTAGTIHAVWVGPDTRIMYSSKPQRGPWAPPETLPGPHDNWGGSPKLVVDGQRTVHVLWSAGTGMAPYYSQKPIQATWLPAERIPGATIVSGKGIALGAHGTIKVAWCDHTGGVKYAWRSSGGTWTAKEGYIWGCDIDVRMDIQIATDPLGLTHLLWRANTAGSGNSEVFYAAEMATGAWTPATNLSETTRVIHSAEMVVDLQGTAHVAWSADGVFYRQRQANGGWSATEVVGPSGSSFVSMTTDSTGSAYAAWIDCSARRVMVARRSFEMWSVPVAIAPAAPPQLCAPPRIALGNRQLVHVLWLTRSNPTGTPTFGVRYAALDALGSWSPPVDVYHDLTYVPENVHLLVDPFDVPHALWIVEHNSGYPVWYAGPEPTQSAGAASLSQVVQVPAATYAPTLSFLYRLATEFPSNSRLEVAVDDGVTATDVFSTTQRQVAWTHQWIDLSPWAGRIVTLGFKVTEEAGGSHVGTTIDEVTVGSAYPDLWVSQPYRQAGLPGQQVVLALSYGNRGGRYAANGHVTLQLPAELTFVSADPPPAATSPVLRWDVGDIAGQSPPQAILVTLRVASSVLPGATLPTTAQITSDTAEPEQTNNADAGAIYVGGLSYLPLINR